MDLQHQRTLVTGGHGFLGRHLLEQLRVRGCRNILAPKSTECDLLDADAVNDLLERERPQVVFHLAARVGGIGANQRRPGTFAYQNLVMGTHLIEACRRAGVNKFIHAGTICSYPKLTPVPFKETDFWNGYPEETNAPYGLAKKMLTVLLQAYRQEFGFRGVTLLLTNLYGPGDNFDPETSHVIPALIRRCLEAKERGEPSISVWGTGKATREFLYVEDAARALILGAERLDDPQPVNVGTGKEIAIYELARLIAEKTEYRGELRFDAAKPDGQPRRCLDITRAGAILGFSPTVTLQEGLERTINWYRRAS
ncbi:MAG: GDP-L-fucose synthase [Gemmataceae bacterium]|nr:GDP-L-fucose synthase [Gemmataceae bacterium]MCI0738240.1 GDP-L-fucose synthase [Gemmataceae bacterium]